MDKNQYHLGLVSASFRGHTPREILIAMKEAGLEYIEWGSDIHAPQYDKQRLVEIASLQDHYKIKCSSYGTYFRLGETDIDALEEYINAAKILGTDILRLWCGSSSNKKMTDAQKTRLIDDCKRAASIAEGNGVVLCMECHKDTFTEDPYDAVSLMKELNSPNFRMYWQPFQWINESENLKIAEMISPYTINLHVFNWKGSIRLPLDNAIESWRTYLCKFPAPRTLLLEFMPDDKLETLKTEADALREIVKGEAI